MERVLVDICKQLNGIRVEIAALTRAIKELKERDDSDELSKKAYRNNFDTVDIMLTNNSSGEST
jgi:hypothetical protein